MRGVLLRVGDAQTAAKVKILDLYIFLPECPKKETLP
jgi:hypothetical protein